MRGRAAFALALLGVVGLTAAEPASARRRARNTDPVIELDASVNASRVRTGDTFQLDVVLTVRTNAPVEELTLPDLSDFRVLRDSRSERSSIKLVQGRRRVSFEKRYTYLLKAETPGVKTIGAARARLGSNRARSRPIKVRVTGQAQRGAARDDEPADAPDKRDPYFLDVRFDKEQVYVGEQATLDVRVYAQSPIDARGFEMPKLPKFWVEKIQTGTSRPTERTINGRRYYVYKLHAAALFPLEPGEHDVGAVQLTVRSGGGLWSRGRSYTLRSDPLTLKALPLPDEGQPPGFGRGNVGRWTLKAALDPPRTEVGEPVTLRILARGEGNPAALELPSVPADLEGARLFPPSFKEQKNVQRGVVHGAKQAEILIQPLQEGRVRLPPLTLRYFDPVTGRYEESRTRPLTLLVGPAGGEAGPTRGERRARIGRGARPIRTRLKAGSGEVLYRSPAFPALVVGLLAAGLASFGIGRRRRAGARTGAARADKARRQNRAALEQAIQHGNLRQMQAAVLQHLALIFGDEVKALSRGELVPWLEERGLPVGRATQVGQFLSDAESVLYAPAGSGDRARLAAEARALLEITGPSSGGEGA